MIKNNMGSTIKRLRMYAELTQQMLADKVGVSRATISSWEVNRTEPTIQDVAHMAEAMGCTIEDITGDYAAALRRDEFLSRIMFYANQMTEDDQKDIIKYMQYVVYKRKEKEEQNVQD